MPTRVMASAPTFWKGSDKAQMSENCRNASNSLLILKLVFLPKITKHSYREPNKKQRAKANPKGHDRLNKYTITPSKYLDILALERLLILCHEASK